MFPNSPYMQGLRRKTLDSLRVNPNAASDWNPDVPLSINPDAARTWQPPAEPAAPPKPAPVKPDTSFNPDLDLQLGFQAGTSDLGNMIYKPAEALYGGHLASGKTLSQGVSEELGPDPDQMAGRSGGFQHAMQFAGRMVPDAARYGLATAAAAGDPILGAAAADAMKADTPGQAVTSGLTSAAMTGLMHNVPGVLAEYGPQVAKDIAGALPSREAMEAARDAANARLQSSGIYSGATAGMGKFLDPATIRDMAISSSASLGSGAISAAERAAAASRQIQKLVRRPTPVEAAGPDGRDVLTRSVEDLERRIPNSQRTVSKDPTKLISGQPFSSLDMDAPSEGFLPFVHLGPDEANTLNGRMWKDAIRESEMPGGSAALESVRRTGARPPSADFLHRAMQLPQRARYWYELSGNSFTGDHIDIPREMQPGFIDNVAATSGGAKPYTNMKRALGTYAENIQNVPIYTDLRDPASVRNALNPALDRLGTHKYQNFSGTMQYTSGLDKRPPLSVNDVQMADMFGIKGSDIGSNPALYEVMSRYVNKVRDAQNALLPEGGQPWETWQVQAPGWVQQRLDKDPLSTYDDYAMVLPRITKELNDAGIETPNGKISLETMMDPRFPNVMSGTRETLMGTPVATVEVASNKTPQGAAAAQLRAHLDTLDENIPWVRDAKKSYEQIQRNRMYDLAQRHGDDPSQVSQLMSEITGQKIDVSRQEPNGYGTYEGDINPNLRIPMGGWGSKGWVPLDKGQREAFLSMMGQDLDQDGMAASHFTTVPHEPDGTPASPTRTYSVFMRRYDNQVDQKAIQAFSQRVGYPVNVSRTPNGILVDVNIADKSVGPTHEAVENAANATFGNDSNVHDMGTIPRDYSSDFVHNSEYQEKIDAHLQKNQPGGSGPAGNPPADLSNLERIRQEIRAIAQKRDADFAKWHAETQARVTPPPKPRPSVKTEMMNGMSIRKP